MRLSRHLACGEKNSDLLGSRFSLKITVGWKSLHHKTLGL